jgi:CheY-like chemotaxis protein
VSKKLLLADDSVTIQKVVNLTFADEGIEVLTAGDGNTALQMLFAHKPDIVIADVNMPGPNGYQICERIKTDENLKNIPVILLVGSFEPFNEEEAKRVGADDFLTKPFQSIRHLMNKVSSLLEASASSAEKSSTKEFDYRALESEEYPVAEIEDVTIHEEPAVSYVSEVSYEERTEKDLARTQPLSPEDIKEIKAEEPQGVSHEEAHEVIHETTQEVAPMSEGQKIEHHIEEIRVELVSPEQEKVTVEPSQEREVETTAKSDVKVSDRAIFVGTEMEVSGERTEEPSKSFKGEERVEVEFEQMLQAESATQGVRATEPSEVDVEQPAELMEVATELLTGQNVEHSIEQVIESDIGPSQLTTEGLAKLAEEETTGIKLEGRQIGAGEAERLTESKPEHHVEPVAETGFTVQPFETQEVAQETIQDAETVQELKEPDVESLASEGLGVREQTFEKEIPQPETVSLLEMGEDEILELPMDLPDEFIRTGTFAPQATYQQTKFEEIVAERKEVEISEPSASEQELEAKSSELLTSEQELKAEVNELSTSMQGLEPESSELLGSTLETKADELPTSVQELETVMDGALASVQELEVEISEPSPSEQELEATVSDVPVQRMGRVDRRSPSEQELEDAVSEPLPLGQEVGVEIDIPFVSTQELEAETSKPSTQELGVGVSESSTSMQETALQAPEKQFSLPPEVIETIAQKVAEKIVEIFSEKTIREIAWEVVPQQAELIIRKMVEEKLKKQ